MYDKLIDVIRRRGRLIVFWIISLLIGSVVAASTFALIGCRGGAGVNKFSDPSATAQDARLLGVFVSPVAVSMSQANEAASPALLDEAWLEEVVERYEALPVRIRTVGSRLCVRLTQVIDDEQAGLTPSGIAVSTTTSQKPALDLERTSWSGNQIVLSFRPSVGVAFPSSGTIVLRDRKTDKDLISIQFDVRNGAE